MNNKINILVIDDEIQIRKLLEITLSSHDYNTILASTAKEGITTAVMHPPDLIILDLGLPDEDGQVVLTKLREWFLGGIIILSVRNSEDEIIKALDNGANDYLTKPFRTGELLARVRSSLRQTQNVENQKILIGATDQSMTTLYQLSNSENSIENNKPLENTQNFSDLLNDAKNKIDD